MEGWTDGEVVKQEGERDQIWTPALPHQLTQECQYCNSLGKRRGTASYKPCIKY